MKKIITILLLALSTSIYAQFQPLNQADWTFNRQDHQQHMAAGQILAALPMFISALEYDSDYINYKKGFLVGGLVSLSAAFGKEVVFDNLMNRGVATYPDLTYTLSGTVSGFLIGYAGLKLVEWRDRVKSNNKLKL